MKLNLFKKITLALTISAALLMSALPVYSVEYTDLSVIEANNIPVVYINIDENAEGFGTIEEMNDSFDHTVKCTGTVQIDVPDGYTGDYSDTILEDTDELQLEYIRGRGNVTWMVDKKPYKFKLDKKAQLLGMGKNKHWALLANRFDASFLRNRVASYISEKMGFAYTPKMLPVDLVMNGEYLGTYFLAETVRIGKSRVNIDELTEEDNTEPNITGGYLLALNPYNNSIKTYPDQNVLTINNNIKIWAEEPEFYSDDGDAAGTPQQQKYITDYLNKTSDAIFGDDFKDSDGIPYTDYMDIQSTADYWWIQEFSRNHDAYESPSNYLYKERDGKLYWGPLWDFDFAFGLYEQETYGFNRAHFRWTDYLRAYNTEYQQLLKERWKVLDSIITDVIKEGGIIDQYAAEQEKSAQTDDGRWGTPYLFHEKCGFKGEVELLRNWMAERQAWINEHIDTDLTKVFCNVTFKYNDEVIQSLTLKDEPILHSYQCPEPPKVEGMVFNEWVDENGNVYNDSTIIYNDIVLTPTYSYDPYYIPEISDVSDVSEISEISEVSEISEISEISEVSEVSEISETSEISEVSEISQASEISEVSQNSQNTEISKQSSPIQNSISDTSKQSSAQISNTSSVPTENIPKTSDTSLIPVFLISALVSFITILTTGKKSKN